MSNVQSRDHAECFCQAFHTCARPIIFLTCRKEGFTVSVTPVQHTFKIHLYSVSGFSSQNGANRILNGIVVLHSCISLFYLYIVCHRPTPATNPFCYSTFSGIVKCSNQAWILDDDSLPPLVNSALVLHFVIFTVAYVSYLTLYAYYDQSLK